MIIISASIDLNKIDKTRIIEGKNGAKYYNITVMVNDTKDKFDNDCSIQQGQTKEERDAKTAPVYLGNGRRVWESTGKANTVSAAPKDMDDLPF